MVRWFFPGFSSFRPPLMSEWLHGSEKYSWKGSKTQIKKKKKKSPQGSGGHTLGVHWTEQSVFSVIPYITFLLSHKIWSKPFYYLFKWPDHDIWSRSVLFTQATCLSKIMGLYGRYTKAAHNIYPKRANHNCSRRLIYSIYLFIYLLCVPLTGVETYCFCLGCLSGYPSIRHTVVCAL